MNPEPMRLFDDVAADKASDMRDYDSSLFMPSWLKPADCRAVRNNRSFAG